MQSNNPEQGSPHKVYVELILRRHIENSSLDRKGRNREHQVQKHMYESPAGEQHLWPRTRRLVGQTGRVKVLKTWPCKREGN